MLTIRCNDAAARVLAERGFAEADPGELGRLIAARGLARDDRGALHVPGVSFRVPSLPPWTSLTDHEAQRNCWHLDDHPDVPVEVDDEGAPHVGPAGRLLMLRQGLALSRTVRTLARALPDRPPTCCVIGVNETGGTFRFHQVRPGESWVARELDGYGSEPVVVVEDRPAP
ncbi:hypothetical protein GCM10010420_07230 [Streptomyces glaucosporus]|uniref:Uncharacterized protein n=1 Tax=Streptomyces glaucosporus TaxID=284044 RepID=A0ABN3HSD6_9ACTN